MSAHCLHPVSAAFTKHEKGPGQFAAALVATALLPTAVKSASAANSRLSPNHKPLLAWGSVRMAGAKDGQLLHDAWRHHAWSCLLWLFMLAL